MQQQQPFVGSRRRSALASSSSQAQERFVMLSLAATVLVAIIGVFLVYAPVFTLSMLGLLSVVLMFIMTERSKTHDAIEFQNRFWTFVGFVLASLCVFIRDSPFRFSKEHNGAAWFIVGLVSYIAHTVDRYIRRLDLKRIPRLPRINSADIGLELKASAKKKIVDLKKYTEVIDNPYVSSTFQNIVNIFRVLHAEQAIITIFEDASKDELNYIMPFVELGLIFYKMKDHKWWQYYYRTKVLRILAVDRLHELNVRSRVYLLHGIQSLTLSANDSCEKLVLGIITSTKGDALSELKSLADAKGDIYNMHKLMYQDIRSELTQRKILSHIKNQAEFLNSHWQLKSKHAMKTIGLQAWRKIISDVDDTLTCSGGASHSLGLAGIDTSFPAKTVYPGVIAFYRELDLGMSGADVWDDSKVGNLVFLSARPHVYKDTTESVSYEKFRKLKLHTVPTLLAGSLDTGFKFAYEGDAEPLAVTKFKNLQEYLLLYPEYKVIFLGDNGQGDVRAAEMALSSPTYTSNIHRVYVHLVQPQALTHRGASPAEEEQVARNTEGVDREHLLLEDKRRRQRTEADKMCFFVTYIDAALDAYAHSLIRTSGLRNVMKEAVQDFEAIKMEKWEADEEKLAAARAAGRGGPRGQGAGGRVVDSLGKYYKTSASGGEVPTANASTRKTDNSAALNGQHPAVSSVWACYGELKRETRIREINFSLQRGNDVLISAGFPPVALFDRKFIVGSRIRSEYGMGVVTRIRKNQPKGAVAAGGGYFGATFEVLVQWDSTGCARPVRLFLQDWAVVSLPAVQLPARSDPPKYFRAGMGGAAAKKPPMPVLLPSVVNLPLDNAIAAERERKEREKFAVEASNKKPGGAVIDRSATPSRFALLTRESVAALPVATPLLPLVEKGEGSASVSSSSHSRSQNVSGAGNTTKSHMQPVPEREEDVPPLDVVIQTSVFRPSVMDRARHAYIRGNRARSSSKHSISSDDDRQSNISGATGLGSKGVGLTSSVGGGGAMAEKDISGFRGAQAWTPYGLGEVVGYRNEEGSDIVWLRQHGACGYVDLFVQRLQVVQLTDPNLTRCYPDDDPLLLEDVGATALGNTEGSSVKSEVGTEAGPSADISTFVTNEADAVAKSSKPVLTAPRSSFVSSWFSGMGVTRGTFPPATAPVLASATTPSSASHNFSSGATEGGETGPPEEDNPFVPITD